MTPFARSVLQWVQQRALFPVGARVLVALSGGPDSCALLLSLLELAEENASFNFLAAAHFHHGIRGADADADAAFCAALCCRCGIPCVIGLGSVPAKNGNYDAAVARELRYGFLEDTAQELGANWIATGHTADDQAETVLWRVLRGTSVDGLTGIPGARRLDAGATVVRPLLGCRRAEIEAYCAGHGIVPRHDPSNDNEHHARVRLRRHLPELARRFNPRLVEALNRLAENAAQDREYLEQESARLFAATVRQEGNLWWAKAEPLQQAHPALRRRALARLVRGALPPQHLEQATTTAFILQLETLLTPTNDGRRITLPGGIQAFHENGQLCLHPPAPLAPPDYELWLPIPGRITLPDDRGTLETRRMPDAGDFLRERRSHIVDCAGDCVKGNAPLRVRNARPGDRMVPLGMPGKSRLVRDILADAKVPKERRAGWPVITDSVGETILWIAGVMQAESTRITEETREVLRLSFGPAENDGTAAKSPPEIGA